jgi:transposase
VNKPMSGSRSFEVLTTNPVRLSSSPARSYRPWSNEEKARIVGETLVAGANVSASRRCAVKWAGSVTAFYVASQGDCLGGGCAVVGTPSRPVRFTRFEAARSDTVEIVIGDVVVRAGGDVELDRLADVIRAVRKAGFAADLERIEIVIEPEIPAGCEGLERF